MVFSYQSHEDIGGRDINVLKSGEFQIKSKMPRMIAVTSGKGGVGKTNVVANLSASLSEMGKKVVVLDADFGLANLDVLLGLTPRYHLGHVLYGDKTLNDIMIEGPKGIQIIPAVPVCSRCLN